jgi:hypothetical protein
VAETPALADEYTISFRVENFGALMAGQEGAAVFFPVEHTIGFDIAEVAISLLDAEFYVNPFTAEGPPDPHAPSHQDGGDDEIDVTGLSGLLADAQTPRATVVTLIALGQPMSF